MRQPISRTPRLVDAVLSLLRSVDEWFRLEMDNRGEQAEKMIARVLWGIIGACSCVVLIAQITMALARFYGVGQ